MATDTCDVVEADNGRDALAKALVRIPDLIITELQLPLIDGLSFCEIVRRDRTTSTVTSLPTDTWPQAQRAEANAVLAKPARADAVHAEAQRLLVESRELRERAVTVHRLMRRELKRTAAILIARATELGKRLKRQESGYGRSSVPTRPPTLPCPGCDRLLVHKRSYLGGVRFQLEQWDEFVCPGRCGRFEYRHRTGALRRLS